MRRRATRTRRCPPRRLRSRPATASPSGGPPPLAAAPRPSPSSAQAKPTVPVLWSHAAGPQLRFSAGPAEPAGPVWTLPVMARGLSEWAVSDPHPSETQIDNVRPWPAESQTAPTERAPTLTGRARSGSATHRGLRSDTAASLTKRRRAPAMRVGAPSPSLTQCSLLSD